nr:glycosyltransferase family 4 protein [Teredinibacter waterburyi]
MKKKLPTVTPTATAVTITSATPAAVSTKAIETPKASGTDLSSTNTSGIKPIGAKLKPLKIALLGYRSSPFVGGQGIYIKYLSKALSDLGHQVDVFSGPPYPELPSGVNLIEVPSLDLYASVDHTRALRWHHLKSFTDTWEWFAMLTGGFAEPYTFGRRIAKVLAVNNYDIIHDNQSLGYGLLQLQNAGHKVISTIHHPIHRDRDLALAAAPDWQHRLLIKRWYSFIRMQERVVKKLHHITTVSENSKRDIEQYFQSSGDNVSVISNGIDTDLFKPISTATRVPFRLITTTSSDQPIKGLAYLLKALAQLRQEFPAVHLVIVGKLKPGGVNEQLIKKLGLNDAIEFRSGISHPQLVEEYSHACIAVCPSLYEGFGLPAGEAMACEVPVVSSDGGALPEVVGDAGILVAAGDEQALANAIAVLLRDPDGTRALGVAARQHILATFCWQRVAEQLSAYYHSLLKN